MTPEEFLKRHGVTHPEKLAALTVLLNVYKNELLEKLRQSLPGDAEIQEEYRIQTEVGMKCRVAAMAGKRMIVNKIRELKT